MRKVSNDDEYGYNYDDDDNDDDDDDADYDDNDDDDDDLRKVSNPFPGQSCMRGCSTFNMETGTKG